MLEGLEQVLGRINAIQGRIKKISDMQKQFHNAMYGMQEPGKTDTKPADTPPPGQTNLLQTDMDTTTSHINRQALNLRTTYGDSAFDDYIKKYSGQFNIPPALIKAVIKQESNFNPAARSAKGALGLMQLMPDTARGLGVTAPFSPDQNIRGGTQYLKDMLTRYNGNLSLALAAYNAGPGAVDRFGGIPAYQETQDYVRKVLQYYSRYS